jgi:hypothetical protein
MSRFWLIGAMAAALLSWRVQAQSTFAAALVRYRSDPHCIGAGYEDVRSAIDTSLNDYHVRDPARAQESVAAGVVAAAQLDQLASAAAAKRCTAQALENWRQVIRTFDGPAFASFQRRAVAGIRAVRRS